MIITEFKNREDSKLSEPERVTMYLIISFSAVFLGVLFLRSVVRIFLETRQETVVRPSGNSVIVEVTGGHSPNKIFINEGEEIHLTFIKRDESECTSEVVMPDFGIKRILQKNTPISFGVIPFQPGEYSIFCGEGKQQASIVAIDQKKKIGVKYYETFS